MRRGIDTEVSLKHAEPPYSRSQTEQPGREGIRPANPDQEIEMLRAQADTMMAQLQAINARISAIKLERGANPARDTDANFSGMTSKATEVGGVVAVVEQNECINCEICANVCPEGAITMEDVAVIDAQRCSGCGLCVDECPNKAICLAIPKEAP